MGSRRNRGGGGIARGALIAGAFAVGMCVLILSALGGLAGAGTLGGFAGLGTLGGFAGAATLGGACGPTQTVGATEYGGPGDPSSGTVGSSGANLLSRPDSYAELGGTSFQTATALGGLPYGTPLEISVGRRSVIAYKEDIGLGGGPIEGHPREIDLWWQLASSLGIPYEHGRWAGIVRVQAPASDCAGAGGLAAAAATPLSPGQRALLLPDGTAAAPVSAPATVQGIIAAGNQIVGRPYVYGGAHGLPLNIAAPDYDCSSSVAHLLYGGGLLPVTADMTSSQFESWGLPGPGRWVTIYASPSHVYMYVAGLRWDTHNAAGSGDGSSGIGWHPLVRGDAGFVVRHPPGL